MYHAIIFTSSATGESKNTWDDWRLIPSSAPVIAEPTLVYKYVDIPGKDGQLDITDYLMGKPQYSDRKGTLEFLAVNNVGDVVNYGPKMHPVRNPRTGQKEYEGYARSAAEKYASWATRKSDISDFLNGQKVKVVLQDDEPEYYYFGRVALKEWVPDAKFSKVVIEYQFSPTKYATGFVAGTHRSGATL